MRTDPELRKTLRDLQNVNKKKLQKYDYPDAIMTVAKMQRFAERGVDFSVGERDCYFVEKMDAQTELGKTIFSGSGSGRQKYRV